LKTGGEKFKRVTANCSVLTLRPWYTSARNDYGKNLDSTTTVRERWWIDFSPVASPLKARSPEFLSNVGGVVPLGKDEPRERRTTRQDRPLPKISTAFLILWFKKGSSGFRVGEYCALSTFNFIRSPIFDILSSMLFQILLFDGFDELDAIAPYEVLKMAAKHLPEWKVEFVTLTHANAITAANGLELVAPSKLLSLDQKPDILVIPGGGWVDQSPLGARGVTNCAEALALLRKLQQSGVILSSVCTGSMILAAAGLLDGRPCITHHSALDDLKKFPVQIIQKRVVDDGDIITAGGITSGLDLALHLIERFAGAPLATQIAAAMEYTKK